MHTCYGEWPATGFRFHPVTCSVGQERYNYLFYLHLLSFRKLNEDDPKQIVTCMMPRFEILAEKKLVGKRLKMSLAKNTTSQLWSSFMPRRKEIVHAITTDLISMQVYDASHSFSTFDFHAAFDKWAAIEVSDFSSVPEGMETFTLPGGLYAVFHYKGRSTDPEIFRYIFGTWLPQSDYVPDHRPHFEILGEKYRNNDPESEEEIWIPVKPRE
jgi:AraC family transcriptional regulator